jgi:hypothetical protein
MTPMKRLSAGSAEHYPQALIHMLSRTWALRVLAAFTADSLAHPEAVCRVARGRLEHPDWGRTGQ